MLWGGIEARAEAGADVGSEPEGAAAPAPHGRAQPGVPAPGPTSAASAEAHTEPGGAPAAAPTPAVNRYVEEAKKRAAAGRCDEALEELSLGEQMPGNPPEVLRDIHLVRGVCAVAAAGGRLDADARREFDRALKIDPEATLPAPFSQALRDLLEAHRQHTVVLRHEPIARVAAGRPVQIRATLHDPAHRVSDLILAWRIDPEDPFTEVVMRPVRAGHYAAFLPLPDLENDPRPLLVDYYLAAVDAQGKVLDSVGSDFHPHTLEVVPAERIEAVDLPVAERPPPPPPPPLYTQWWVYAAAGAALLLLGGGVALATARPPEPPQGSLGTFELPLEPRR